MSAGDEVIQVVATEGMQHALREWLASRGQYLYQIPVEDDLPTFGIGIASTEIPLRRRPPAEARARMLEAGLPVDFVDAMIREEKPWPQS